MWSSFYTNMYTSLDTHTNTHTQWGKPERQCLLFSPACWCDETPRLITQGQRYCCSVWSQAAEMLWGWAMDTHRGVGSARCAACLITDWIGALWPLSRSALTLDPDTAGLEAMLIAFSNNTRRGEGSICVCWGVDHFPFGHKECSTTQQHIVQDSWWWCSTNLWTCRKKGGIFSCLYNLINYSSLDLSLSQSVTEGNLHLEKKLIFL